MTMGVHKTHNMRQCDTCERHLHITHFPWNMVLSRFRAKEGYNHKRKTGDTCHYCLAQEAGKQRNEQAARSWSDITVGAE